LSSDLTLGREYPLGPPLIGALLRMPADAVVARIFLDLHHAGFTDLVPAHFAVLRYPGPEDRRPSELAAEAGMTKQAMNYLLGQMQQLGYLTRDDDPEDQRFKRVHLTERGHAAARAVRESVAAIEAELEQQLGPAQFDQLRRLLIQLNATSFVRESHHRPLEAPRRPRQALDPTEPSSSSEPSTSRSLAMKASVSTEAALASATDEQRRSAPWSGGVPKLL
jgi:DNA-binding MarR family transcriptional regulator